MRDEDDAERPVIRNLTATECGVELDFGGADPLRLSWTWLRDNARDAESFLDTAQQRLVSPSTVARCGVGRARLTDVGVEIAWPDGPTGIFEARDLASLGDQRSVAALGVSAVPWNGAELRARLTPIGYESLIDSTRQLRAAIDEFWATGVLLITSVPTDPESTRRVLERFGYVRRTIFGDVWEFGSDGRLDDTASTRLEITPHTDGTYSHDAPGLLGLHCYVADVSGGQSVVVDGAAVTERLSEQARTLLTQVDIPGRYVGDGAHLVASRPALRHDGDRLVQVSYNHHDRAPFVLPEPMMGDLYAALHEFDALANDAELQFEWPMRPGDMVIIDNWRVLHGRRAFRGERTMGGGYVNREDVESTTRLLSTT